MNNKFTDEQLDLIAKNLLNDYALNHEKLDEIADSPTIWWNIKREISLQKPEGNKGWIIGWFRQLAVFGVFAGLVVCLGLGFIWILNVPKTEQLVKVENPIVDLTKVVEPQIEKPIVNNEIEKKSTFIDKTTTKESREIIAKTKNEVSKINQTKTANLKIERQIIKQPQIKSSTKKTPKTVEARSSNTEEVKTEFISLSYMPTPESGQIVRVKVPRAMMVSLGVSNNVSKNAEMVSAEVILGEDGSSRAIRFISTNNR
jgi:hypothetical protein